MAYRYRIDGKTVEFDEPLDKEIVTQSGAMPVAVQKQSTSLIVTPKNARTPTLKDKFKVWLKTLENEPGSKGTPFVWGGNATLPIQGKYSDSMESLLSNVGNGMTANFFKHFETPEQKQKTNKFNNEHKGLSLVSNAAGMIIPTILSGVVGAGPAASGFVAKNAPKLTKFIPKTTAKKAAASAAVYSGLSSFNDGGDAGDVLKDTITGAVFGGAAGKGMDWMTNILFKKKFLKAKNFLEHVGGQEKIDEALSKNRSLAETGGDRIEDFAAGLSPDKKAKNLFLTQLEKTKNNAKGDVTQAIDKYITPQTDVPKVLEDMLNMSKSKYALADKYSGKVPNYNVAPESEVARAANYLQKRNPSLNPTRKLDVSMTEKELPDFLKQPGPDGEVLRYGPSRTAHEAQQSANAPSKIEYRPGDPNNFKLLNEVKKYLNANSQHNMTTPYRRMQMQDELAGLRAALHGANPDLKAADVLFATQAKAGNAMDFGKRLKKSTSGDIAEFNAVKPSPLDRAHNEPNVYGAPSGDTSVYGVPYADTIAPEAISQFLKNSTRLDKEAARSGMSQAAKEGLLKYLDRDTNAWNVLSPEFLNKYKLFNEGSKGGQEIADALLNTVEKNKNKLKVLKKGVSGAAEGLKQPSKFKQAYLMTARVKRTIAEAFDKLTKGSSTYKGDTAAQMLLDPIALVAEGLKRDMIPSKTLKKIEPLLPYLAAISGKRAGRRQVRPKDVPIEGDYYGI